MNQRDLAILALGEQRSGVVTKADLNGIGLHTRAISRRVTAGLLTPFALGVYTVGAASGSATIRRAALLAEPMAAASHYTAAKHWGLGTSYNARGVMPEIVVARSHRRDLPGVIVHSTTYLPADHVDSTDGWRITTPERTLADTIFRRTGVKRARHTVQRAIADKIVEPDRLLKTHLRLARRGRPGTVFTRMLCEELLGRDGYPASELEIRLDTAMRERGITSFTRQFTPPWYEGGDGIVDFADPEARLIVEVDGRRWHATEQAQQSDRQRDRQAQRSGWRVIRFTWIDVVHDIDGVIADIDAIRNIQFGATTLEPVGFEDAFRP